MEHNDKSVINAIREYIAMCPLMKQISEKAYIDFTSEEPENYGIFPGGETILKTYTDGTEIKEYNFTINLRQYTPEDAQRLENQGFLEEFTLWLKKQSRMGVLPNLDKQKRALKIEGVLGTLFDLDETGETGLYQLQCKLQYLQKGD